MIFIPFKDGVLDHAFNFIVASAVTPPVEGDPLSMSLETFKEQIDTGLSLYAAAQEALKGFRTQKDVLNTFIVTGNPLPWVPADRPAWLGLNMQKVMAWRLMEIFSKSYSKEGSRCAASIRGHFDLS